MADPKSTALKGGLGAVKRLLSPKEKYVPGVHYADPLAPPTMRMSEALGNVGAEGKTLNFTEADRSRVFGPNRGGVGFSGLQHYSEPHKQAGTSWGFGNKLTAEKKIRQNKPDESLWTTFVGAPEQHKSNTVVIQDAINDFQQAARAGKVHPAQIKLMNERLRNLRDDKTGALLFDKSFDLTDPEALSAATTFSRRSGIGDVLMGGGVKGEMRKKPFKAEHGNQVWNPAGDMEALLKRETDPDLVGAGTYDVGNRLFTMEGDVVYRPDLNIAFPWQTTGLDLGVKYELAPKEAAMRDWMKQYEGRIGKGGKPAPVGYMDLARNQPSQFVDEDYLTFLQKLGYKDGGEVNMEEADARLRAAIGKHMAKGGEVDLDAADARLNAAVAQHMAGGGEMVKGAAKGIKRLFGEKVLPAAERDANLQKFLEPSKAPMRLYHATTATEGNKGEEAVRRLKPSKEGALGSGAYLTPKADFANQYASGAGGNVLPVHAQIKNPLIIEGKGDPMIEALVKLGMDESKAANMVERAYDQKGYIGKEVQTRAQAQGYDGLMQYRDGDLNEVVTYQPGAVKSAIGNEGTYDTMQLDLNKADGGKILKGAAQMGKRLFSEPAGRIIQAPSVIIPSKVSNVKEAARQSKGEYGARRVERAADEVPSLERLYTEEALREAFLGDNAKALMTMSPSSFEEYALRLPLVDSVGPKMAELAKQGDIDKYTVPSDEYIKYLQRVQGGFKEMPYLDINKEEFGLPLMPFISGHEGRHRSRAMAASGEPSSLVRLQPRAELREPFPRRSQEEYIEALKKELEMTDNMVLPQDFKRPPLKLPDIYAEGGVAHMAPGGLLKGAGKLGKRLLGGADNSMPAGKGGTRKFGEDMGGLSIVKESGGNWVAGAGSPEAGLKPLRRTAGEERAYMDFVREQNKAGDDYGNWVTEKVKQDPAFTKISGVKAANKYLAEKGQKPLQVEPQEAALNAWVDRNLTNYVKKQMGTADDPVRKLAEEGVVHIPSSEVGVNRYKAKDVRAGLGMPQLGKSEAAKAWEDSTDYLINVAPASKHTKPLSESEIRQGFRSTVEENPWLEKVAPDTPIYAAKSDIGSDLGFDHIMDVLRMDVAAGRIRPEQLNKVSMEQAVRRTYEYDQEMARKMAEAQIKATEGMPTHKDYGDKGYKWIELTSPKMPEGWAVPERYSIVQPTPGAETLAIMDKETGKYITTGLKSEAEAVKHLHDTINKDALSSALKYEGETMGHCVGNYCEDVAGGKSRIFSLRSAKGEPHVTIETKPGDFSKAFDNLTSEEQAAVRKVAGSFASDEALLDAMKQVVPEKANIPESIIQIKGKQNRAPNEEYLPFVQDFVKSGKWSDVGEIQNTGLQKWNDRYLSRQEIDALTPEESDAFASRNINRANGGGMAEGGAAFKKIQFMDKGGITTSGGTFSAEDIDPSVSYIPNYIKKNAAEIGQETKAALGSDYERLASSQGAREQLAKITAAQLVGGVPDLAHLGLELVDFLKDAVFTKPRPRSVLEGPYNPQSMYASEHERVPRFGSIADVFKRPVLNKDGSPAIDPETLKPVLGYPLGGSEDMIQRAQEAKLMGPGRFHPLTELPSAIIGGLGAARAGKTISKGVKRFVDEPKSKKTQSHKRGGLTQLKVR